MINFRVTDSGVLVVQPSGPITEADFAAVQSDVDPWLKSGGKLKGLLIDAPDFPGWENFAGFRAHLKFVKDHHREIPRVAVVSNDDFLIAMPKLARHFVKAEFRRYNAGETADAIEWLESPLEAPKHAVRHAWFPREKLIWVSVDGKVSTDEYRALLNDLEPIIKENSPVSFLVDLEDLEGVEFGAMIADTKFGFSHIKHIKRIAIVGDQKWIKRLTSLPNPFAMEVKGFDEDDEHQAWNWIIS
ncbi:STAS/SEC14 domain-containing protein [Haloferula chungangensis]|uniref:STAS/SEC14 domain-containing protein n=1 Tax=Haloferula chungangensis TaxID=1048331 RepID=A0ABW2LBC0_9BACT